MRRALDIVMFALALVVLYALCVEIQTFLESGRSIVNFLSFFTIESNVFAALVLIAAPHRAVLRGAVTVYMATTGVVFIAVLSGGDSGLLPWVNVLFHYVMPAAMLATWLLDPPMLRMSYLNAVLAWLAFPLVFAVYSLVRGPIAGWYPYPFLDPRVSGAGGVIAAVVAIAAFIALVALGLCWYAKWRAAFSSRG